VIRNDQTAELGNKEMKNAPNAPMERAERITLLRQSIAREIATPNSTGPTLRQEIHEWRENVTNPSVDPEQEIQGVFTNTVTAISSVGKWLIERYQWLIALALLSLFAPVILWSCVQGCFWGLPKCLKCCIHCWRPRRKRKENKESQHRRQERPKESVELLESKPASEEETTVHIDTSGQRVYFVPAREGGPEAAPSKRQWPSWGVPWKAAIVILAILVACLPLPTVGATDPTHHTHQNKKEVRDNNPCLLGFRTMDPIEEIVLDYDEDSEEEEAPAGPRPELAPAIGPPRGAPLRPTSSAAHRVRRFCNLLGD
jgi:hypothetical protein